MVDMMGNNFFEEDDEFFADAFRSISELETSSSLKAAEESELRKQKDVVPNDEIFPPTHQNQSENSISGISSFYNDNDLCAMKNTNKINNCPKISPLTGNSSFIVDENYSTNHRFLPGYTPKATKRKFPGPAGILIDEPPRKLSIGNSDVSKNFEDVELGVELIKSSQFSVEELLETVSWKKLQEDVSSNHSFLSNAKHFSVQRVLSDTSKKRLPKHVVVPILCLYIKKFNPEEPISTYMDDTGEISGKVDKEVLKLYRNYIKAGTSLILRKITFVCNIMLLEKSNLVSVYLDDGTVQHIQKWDVLTEERLDSLGCIFPVTPKVLEKSARLGSLNATPILKQTHNTSSDLVPSSRSRTFLQKSLDHTNFNPPQISHFENLNTNDHQHITSDANDHQNITTDANNDKNISKDETNFSHPDLKMDDFDELLGNLDEKSFLEDF